MITEQEAQRWIGRFVDLMISEYMVDDSSKPDETKAFGMHGKLKSVVTQNGIVCLTLGDDSMGDYTMPLDEVVAIEEGVNEEEWKKLGAKSLLGIMG